MAANWSWRNRPRREKKETIAAPAVGNSSDNIWRDKLSKYREEMNDFIRDWGKKYEEKELVIQSYLHLLYKSSDKERSKSDVNVDMGILEGLQTILEHNIVDGEKNYTKYQIAVIHALKKIGMMLQELSRILKEGIIKLDNEFRSWIRYQLYNEDWVDYLGCVREREPQVVDEANALGIPINEEILSFEHIRDENPDDIKQRLMVYREELREAHNMPQENVDCIASGPKMCELIKTVRSKLTRTYLVEVDDIKEERRDGDNSAEVTAAGQKRRRRTEVSELKYQFGFAHRNNYV